MATGLILTPCEFSNRVRRTVESLSPIRFLFEEHILSSGSASVNGAASLNGSVLEGVPADAFPAPE
jgi:hypothetical protein